MRAVFHDPALNDDILYRGYTHHQLLDAAEVNTVLQQLDQIFSKSRSANPQDSSFFSTYEINDPEVRRLGNRIARDVFSPHLPALLDGYRILTAGFFVKAPGGGEVALSAHPLIADSLKHNVVNIWCPLVETNVENGTLHVIPYSHKIFKQVIYPQYVPFFSGYFDLIKNHYSIALPSRPGQAVCFDDTLLHWSPDNNSSKPRYAIHCACIPDEATPAFVHFDQAKPDRFAIYEASEEFYMNEIYALQQGAPTHMKLIDTVENVNRPFTHDQFERHIMNQAEIRKSLDLEWTSVVK